MLAAGGGGGGGTFVVFLIGYNVAIIQGNMCRKCHFYAAHLCINCYIHTLETDTHTHTHCHTAALYTD